MSLDITAALQGLVDAESAVQYSAGQTAGQVAGAESRQAEVDQLRHDLEVSEADGADLARRLATAVRERDSARGDLAALRADYDAHMATHAVRTAFGACPTAGTPTSSVLSKYGSKASVRIFIAGALARVTRPDASRVHVSWKPALGSPITEAQVLEACTGLREGDLVEVWHEADVKGRKGTYPLSQTLAAAAQFHDRVTALRDAGRIPQVLTCHTVGGWSVDSSSKVDPASPIIHAPADVFGVDMDGIDPQDAFYPFADRQMGRKLADAFKAGGYRYWTVPEFTMPSVPSDPDRTKRVAWFKAEVAKIAQGRPDLGLPAPIMVAWFDTTGIIGDSERLTAANEIAAWSALVSSNA